MIGHWAYESLMNFRTIIVHSLRCNATRVEKKPFVRTFHGMLAYLLKPLDSLRNIGNNPYFFCGVLADQPGNVVVL